VTGPTSLSTLCRGQSPFSCLPVMCGKTYDMTGGHVVQEKPAQSASEALIACWIDIRRSKKSCGRGGLQAAAGAMAILVKVHEQPRMEPSNLKRIK